jgi:hypothetical protein
MRVDELLYQIESLEIFSMDENYLEILITNDMFSYDEA